MKSKKKSFRYLLVCIPFVKTFYESGSLISQRELKEKQKPQGDFLDQGRQVKGVYFNWSKMLFFLRGLLT